MIRESDTTARNGLLNSLQLSQDKEFDKVIHFQLSRRQTKEVKTNPNIRLLSSISKFDKLPPHQKTLYPMSLRVVRIKIGEERYESLVTKLNDIDQEVLLFLFLFHHNIIWYGSIILTSNNRFTIDR